MGGSFANVCLAALLPESDRMGMGPMVQEGQPLAKGKARSAPFDHGGLSGLPPAHNAMCRNVGVGVHHIATTAAVRSGIRNVLWLRPLNQFDRPTRRSIL